MKIKIRRWTYLAAVIAFLSLGASASGTAVPVGSDLSALGWKTLSFRGIPETQFQGGPDNTIEIVSEKSSSVLYLPIEGAARQSQSLSWSWRVEDGLPATDLTKNVGDDRNLSVHVAFADGDVVSRFLGLFSPFAGGRALTYVWGGEGVAHFPHPHRPDDVWIYVLRPADAPLDQWIMENVDLEADFKRVFGEAPPPIAAIGVSSDADALGLTARGMVRNLTLN